MGGGGGRGILAEWIRVGWLRTATAANGAQEGAGDGADGVGIGRHGREKQRRGGRGRKEGERRGGHEPLLVLDVIVVDGD